MFTQIGAEKVVLPIVHVAAQVYLRRFWSDPWELYPFELVEADYRVAGAGSSSATFVHRYGAVALPGLVVADFTELVPLDLNNYFCKIEMYSRDENRFKTIFQGKVRNDSRQLRNGTTKLSGVQTFVADGPLSDLARVEMYQSVWANQDLILDIIELGWLPGMNLRGPYGTLVGNRSSDSQDGVFVYGGKGSIWTHLDYLLYVVKYYLNQSGKKLPRVPPLWTVSGAVDVIDQLETSIAWGKSVNLAEVCQRLIPREFGVDYKITYQDYGYNIEVFTLLSESTELYGAEISGNSNQIEFTPGNLIDVESVNVVRSSERSYDGLRLLGERVVMCATLSLNGAFATGEVGGGELVKGWTEALQAEYIVGAGTPAENYDAHDHDRARSKQKFRDVFQRFVIDLDWDYRGAKLSPLIKLDGSLDLSDFTPFQTGHFQTLGWIPLKSGFDYSRNPAVDNNIEGAEPAPIAPLAWIYDTRETILYADRGVKNPGGTPGFVEVTSVGIGLSVLKYELGVILNASPNHLLALNHAFAQNSDEEATTLLNQPLYDYQFICVTLAWMLDKNLEIGIDLPDDLKSGDGSLKIIEVPNCELWLIAPNTIVGTNPDGTLQKSGDVMRIERDDSLRLKMAGAGAKARYIEDRIKAEVVMKSQSPWVDYVGQILKTIEEPGQGGGRRSQAVGAPITSMKWFKTAKGVGMSFRTGYAGQ